MKRTNTTYQILFASLAGTTIEFFDFYIYATAAVLIFPHLFFPRADAGTATLNSLATFGVAFLARPIGAVLFGHYGDRFGRKRTLVAALLTMGLSTFIIGILPGYNSVHMVAPVLLALCRFGQGIGLGGEWGGAVLLAVENAPPNKRAVYGMFPQLGAPLGFLMSACTFVLLSHFLSESHFNAYGWRLPFLASSILVILGLYVRLKVDEPAAFKASLRSANIVSFPLGETLRSHARAVIAGILTCIATYVLFYILTVFVLSWGTSTLHYGREQLLLYQLLAVLLFAITIPLSALAAERGRRAMMFFATILIVIFGLILEPLFSAGIHGTAVMMLIGFSIMGLTYGPLGTVVSEMFPTEVRYTGSSLAFSLAGIAGASVAPYIATWLAKSYGLKYVGYYLICSAAVTFLGLLLARDNKGNNTVVSMISRLSVSSQGTDMVSKKYTSSE